jgi:hypothetical protein
MLGLPLLDSLRVVLAQLECLQLECHQRVSNKTGFRLGCFIVLDIGPLLLHVVLGQPFIHGDFQGFVRGEGHGLVSQHHVHV